MLIGQIDYRCPHCGSSEIESDWTDGYCICTTCNKSFAGDAAIPFVKIETLTGLQWERREPIRRCDRGMAWGVYNAITYYPS